MQLFTTVHEAIRQAGALGISTTQIAAALNLTKQNFNNKLKGHGSKFTPVHEAAIESFLVNEFTAVHAKLSALLHLVPSCTLVHVPLEPQAPVVPDEAQVISLQATEGGDIPAAQIQALAAQAKAGTITAGPIDLNALLNPKPQAQPEQQPVPQEVIVLSKDEEELIEQGWLTLKDVPANRIKLAQYAANNEKELLPF